MGERPDGAAAVPVLHSGRTLSREDAEATGDRMALPGAEGKEKTMSPKALSWVVALDGGTTNTRARLLHDGQVVATARRAVGVRDAVLSGGSNPLATAVRAVVRDVLDAAVGVRP